jgi:hypothetical protein
VGCGVSFISKKFEDEKRLPNGLPVPLWLSLESFHFRTNMVEAVVIDRCTKMDVDWMIHSRLAYSTRDKPAASLYFPSIKLWLIPSRSNDYHGMPS